MKARPSLSGSDASDLKLGSNNKESGINPIKEVLGRLRFHLDNLKRAKEREQLSKTKRILNCESNVDNTGTSSHYDKTVGSTDDGDKVVDTTSHKDESGRNDSDKDKSEDETAGDRNDSDDEKSEDETAGNESDDASSSDYSYNRSDQDLISSSRNSEGGYDSVDALLDSVE